MEQMSFERADSSRKLRRITFSFLAAFLKELISAVSTNTVITCIWFMIVPVCRSLVRPGLSLHSIIKRSPQ